MNKVLQLLLLVVAGAVQSATVERVVGKASARPGAHLAEGAAFSTGQKSRAKLAGDAGFLITGSNTEVRLTKNGGVALDRGLVLVGSDPAARRRSIPVSMPNFRMRVTGTVLALYLPGRWVKFICREGTVEIALQSLLGESVTLQAGDELLVQPTAKALPSPVQVDLGRLADTSTLTNGLGPLSTQALMDAAIAGQQMALDSGSLRMTPFLMRGASPELALVRPAAPASTAASAALPRDEATIFSVTNREDNPEAVLAVREHDDGIGYFDVGNTTFFRDGAATQLYRVKLSAVDNGVTLMQPRIHGTLRADADLFGGTDRTLEFSTTDSSVTVVDVDTANVLTPPDVALKFIAPALEVTGSVLKAGDALDVSELLHLHATTGDVIIANSTLRGGTVSIGGSSTATAPQAVHISASEVTANRRLSVGEITVPTSITIEQSSQLLSLIEHVSLASGGGDVLVSASTLRADKGTLTIDALAGDGVSGGKVTLLDATMSARVLRVRGWAGVGDDALLIRGGSYDADVQMRLYAEGAGAVVFDGQVQLTTPHAVIAGDKVRVNTGSQVSVSGSASVHSNQHQYNNGTHGTLTTGGGLTQHPYNTRPAF